MPSCRYVDNDTLQRVTFRLWIEATRNSCRELQIRDAGQAIYNHWEIIKINFRLPKRIKFNVKRKEITCFLKKKATYNLNLKIAVKVKRERDLISE